MADTQINARDPQTHALFPLHLYDNGDGTYSLNKELTDVTLIKEKTDYLQDLEDGVYYSESLGAAGTDWPIGTAQKPSNSVADVMTMCAARNLTKVYITGTFSLPLISTDMTDYKIFGSSMGDIVDFGDGSTDVSNSWFENCTLKGTQGGTGLIFGKNVVLNGVRNMSAILSDATLRDRAFSGDIAFAVRDGGFVDIKNAVVVFSDVPACGFSMAEIDFNNATTLTGAAIIGFKGVVGIKNMTNSNSNFVICGEDDACVFGSASNTAGYVYISGYCAWFGGGIYSGVWNTTQSKELQSKLDNTLGPYTVSGWIGQTLPNLLAKLGNDPLTIKERFDNLDSAVASNVPSQYTCPIMNGNTSQTFNNTAADKDFIVSTAASGLPTTVDANIKQARLALEFSLENTYAGVNSIDCTTSTDNQLQIGLDVGLWAEERPKGDTSNSWRWSSISDDGSKMLAIINLNRMYLYSGGSWAETQPAGNVSKDWYCCAMNSDGLKMLATVVAGRAYLYSGGSWAETRPVGNVDRYWQQCDISGDGSTMIACCATLANGRVYVYSSGSWAETLPAGTGTKEWSTCCISKDGSKMLVGINPAGRMYLYSGGTWAETQPAGNTDKNWISCVMSDDGSKMMAGSTQRLYLYSGGTWSEIRPVGDVNRVWSSCDMNSDGTIMCATDEGYRMYVYSNGVWSETRPAGDTDQEWTCCSLAQDNNKMIATVGGGRLYSFSGGTFAYIDLQNGALGDGQFVDGAFHIGTQYGIRNIKRIYDVTSLMSTNIDGLIGIRWQKARAKQASLTVTLDAANLLVDAVGI